MTPTNNSVMLQQSQTKCVNTANGFKSGVSALLTAFHCYNSWLTGAYTNQNMHQTLGANFTSDRLFTFRPANARPFLNRPFTQPGHKLRDNSASVRAFTNFLCFSKQKERLPKNLWQKQVLTPCVESGGGRVRTISSVFLLKLCGVVLNCVGVMHYGSIVVSSTRKLISQI